MQCPIYNAVFSFCSQNRAALCVCLLSQDTLILKVAKHQLSVHNKMISVDCLFSSLSAIFEKAGLKYKINEMHKFAHTNK